LPKKDYNTFSKFFLGRCIVNSIAQLAGLVKREVLVEGHFVFTSGVHGLHYLDKTQLSKELLVQIAYTIATMSDSGVQAVVAPEEGAVPLGEEVARQLSIFVQEDIPFFRAKKGVNGFYLSEKAKAFIRGKSILAVEDNTTTGGTLAAVVSLLRKAGADVVGAAVLWNRGSITAGIVNVPWLFCVIDEPLPHFEPGPETCPGCRDNIPLSAELGHALK